MPIDNIPFEEMWELPEDFDNEPKSFFGKDSEALDPLFTGQFYNISENILTLHDPIQEAIGYVFAGGNLASGLIFLILHQKLNSIIPYNLAKVLFAWSIFLRFLSGFFLNSSRISCIFPPVVNFDPGSLAYWIGRVLVALGKGTGLTSVILHLAIIHILYKRKNRSSRPWFLFTHLIILHCALLSSIFWFIFAHWTAGYYGMVFLIWFVIAVIGGLIWDVYSTSPDEKDAPLTVAYTKRIYIVGLINMLNIVLAIFVGALGISWELICDSPFTIYLSLCIVYGLYNNIWNSIQKIYKAVKLLFPPKEIKVVSLQSPKPQPEPFFLRVAPPKKGPKFDSLAQTEPREIVTIPDIFGAPDHNVPTPRADVYVVD